MLNRLLKKVCNNENVKLLKCNISENNKANVEYRTIYEILVIEYENGSEKHKKSFFIKSPLSFVYGEIGLSKMYEKEIYVYEKILSQFEMLIDYKLNPIYYYSDEKFNIILEDLRENGYRSYKRHNFIDFEYCIKIMQELATYHALTHKLIATSPELFDDDVLEECLYSSTEIDFNLEKRICKIVQHTDSSFANEYAEKLNTFAKHLKKNAVREIKSKVSLFKVLAHGNFCSANLMFKYDKYGNLKNIKIINFQTSFVSDPSIDIITFIILSIEFEIFDKYFDLLLEIYVNSLNRLLKYLECDRIYGIDELRSDIENKYNFWIYLIITHMPMTMSTTDEANKDLRLGDFVTSDEERYIKLSKKWFQYFIEKSLEGPTSKIFLSG
ncbi:hypothetical protein PGB90_002535 [Kerria lacca]